jgi:hypothetical protein
MTDRPNNQDAEVAGSGHPSEDELSAYLNADIADLDDLQRLQAHLETCASCREHLAELRAVVWLLRGVENPVPSRSFRLDPSMVGAPVARIDPWIVRIQPALRRLTAIAAVLLVMLVVADGLVHQNSGEGGVRSVSGSSSTSQTTSGSSAVLSAAAAQTESTSAGAGVQQSVSSPAAVAAATAASAADTTAKTSDAGTAAAAATSAAAPVAQPAATGQPQPEPSPTSEPVKHTGTSYWRLIELAVGVVVIWLLFSTVALPRLVRQREP